MYSLKQCLLLFWKYNHPHLELCVWFLIPLLAEIWQGQVEPFYSSCQPPSKKQKSEIKNIITIRQSFVAAFSHYFHVSHLCWLQVNLGWLLLGKTQLLSSVPKADQFQWNWPETKSLRQRRLCWCPLLRRSQSINMFFFLKWKRFWARLTFALWFSWFGYYHFIND